MENYSEVDNLIKRNLTTLLSLSLCNTPVSLDEVLTWNLDSPKKLWFLLNESIRNNWMIESEKPNVGTFKWINKEVQSQIILSSSIEDWKNILINESIIKLAIELLNYYADNSDRKMILALFKGLVNSEHHNEFPLGKIGYMKIVYMSCKNFFIAPWRDISIIEKANKIALDFDEKEAQAIFYCQLSTYSLFAGNSGLSKNYIEKSINIANQLGDSSLYDAANLGYAATMVTTGQLKEGIAIFEEFLGDVPDDIICRLENIYQYDPDLPVNIIGILGLGYSCLGQPNRTIDLLYRLVRRGEKEGRKSVINLSWQFIALTYLAHDEIRPTREKARLLYEFWKTEGTLGYPQALWGAAVLLATLLIEENKPEEAIEVLKVGDRARRESNFLHFYGNRLLKILEWLEDNGYEQIDGLTLNSEIERNLNWPDRRMQGVAHYFAARKAIKENNSEEVVKHYSQSCDILRNIGATYDLTAALTDFGKWEKSLGNSSNADRLFNEADQIKSIIPPLALMNDSTQISHENIALTILELGRLITFSTQLNNLWGELAAKICALLGSERCIVIEDGNPKQILALRGGGKYWAEEILTLISSSEFKNCKFLVPPWNEDDLNNQGQLLIIPFHSNNLKRRGWVGLENRHTMPLITEDDKRIPDALGHQIAILFENAIIWRNLQEVQSKLDRENQYYRQNVNPGHHSKHILGTSKAILHTLNLVKKVALTNSTVLITGETGVGKELIARELHNLSSRKSGPFISVHIASMAPGLVSSELFGHEKGAFTGAIEQSRGRFELSHNGTLFLDEIGELSLEDQIKILRVLQEGTFERVGGSKIIHSDFRLIVATNRDLKEAVRKGRFREDLYYRLNVFPIDVPPLRERKEDIPILALFFMEQCNRKLGKNFEGISEIDMEKLLSYNWPGNIRELMFCIERCAILSDGPKLRIPVISSDDLLCSSNIEIDNYSLSLENVERAHILRILKITKGKITGEFGAAKILGLKPSTLNFRITKLGLQKELKLLREQ